MPALTVFASGDLFCQLLEQMWNGIGIVVLMAWSPGGEKRTLSTGGILISPIEGHAWESMGSEQMVVLYGLK